MVPTIEPHTIGLMLDNSATGIGLGRVDYLTSLSFQISSIVVRELLSYMIARHLSFSRHGKPISLKVAVVGRKRITDIRDRRSASKAACAPLAVADASAVTSYMDSSHSQAEHGSLATISRAKSSRLTGPHPQLRARLIWERLGYCFECGTSAGRHSPRIHP